MSPRVVRAVAPLAAIALLHAMARFIADPRPIEGLLRPVLAVWFVGLGGTYALTWVGHERGLNVLPWWGILSSAGYLLDNLGAMPAAPPTPFVVALNWMGVGIGVALAATAFAVRQQA